MQMPPSEPGDADYPKTRLNALSTPAAADDLDALVRDMGEAALNKSHELPAEPPIVNNCRVRDAEGGEEAPSEEEFEEDLEEEVVEREALKKQSGSILDKATKKTKKRGRKKAAD